MAEVTSKRAETVFTLELSEFEFYLIHEVLGQTTGGLTLDLYSTLDYALEESGLSEGPRFQTSGALNVKRLPEEVPF